MLAAKQRLMRVTGRGLICVLLIGLLDRSLEDHGLDMAGGLLAKAHAQTSGADLRPEHSFGGDMRALHFIDEKLVAFTGDRVEIYGDSSEGQYMTPERTFGFGRMIRDIVRDGDEFLVLTESPPDTSNALPSKATTQELWWLSAKDLLLGTLADSKEPIYRAIGSEGDGQILLRDRKVYWLRGAQLTILEIQSDQTATRFSSLALPSPYRFTVSGQYLWLADRVGQSVSVFDIGSPNTMSFLSRSTLRSDIRDIYALGRHAFVSTKHGLAAYELNAVQTLRPRYVTLEEVARLAALDDEHLGAELATGGLLIVPVGDVGEVMRLDDARLPASQAGPVLAATSSDAEIHWVQLGAIGGSDDLARSAPYHDVILAEPVDEDQALILFGRPDEPALGWDEEFEMSARNVGLLSGLQSGRPILRWSLLIPETFRIADMRVRKDKAWFAFNTVAAPEREPRTEFSLIASIDLEQPVPDFEMHSLPEELRSMPLSRLEALDDEHLLIANRGLFHQLHLLRIDQSSFFESIQNIGVTSLPQWVFIQPYLYTVSADGESLNILRWPADGGRFDHENTISQKASISGLDRGGRLLFVRNRANPGQLRILDTDINPEDPSLASIINFSDGIESVSSNGAVLFVLETRGEALWKLGISEPDAPPVIAKAGSIRSGTMRCGPTAMYLAAGSAGLSRYSAQAKVDSRPTGEPTRFATSRPPLPTASATPEPSASPPAGRAMIYLYVPFLSGGSR